MGYMKFPPLYYPVIPSTNQPEREYYCSHMPIYYPISSKLAARAPENGAAK